MLLTKKSLLFFIFIILISIKTASSECVVNQEIYIPTQPDLLQIPSFGSPKAFSQSGQKFRIIEIKGKFYKLESNYGLIGWLHEDANIEYSNSKYDWIKLKDICFDDNKQNTLKISYDNSQIIALNSNIENNYFMTEDVTFEYEKDLNSRDKKLLEKAYRFAFVSDPQIHSFVSFGEFLTSKKSPLLDSEIENFFQNTKRDFNLGSMPLKTTKFVDSNISYQYKMFNLNNNNSLDKVAQIDQSYNKYKFCYAAAIHDKPRNSSFITFIINFASCHDSAVTETEVNKILKSIYFKGYKNPTYYYANKKYDSSELLQVNKTTEAHSNDSCSTEAVIKPSIEKKSKTEIDYYFNRYTNMYVDASSLYLRDQPNGDIIYSLKKDQLIAVIEKDQQWSKIIDADGQIGYVSSQYISPRNNENFKNTDSKSQKNYTYKNLPTNESFEFKYNFVKNNLINSDLKPCLGNYWDNCFGSYTLEVEGGEIQVSGEFKNDQLSGSNRSESLNEGVLVYNEFGELIPSKKYISINYIDEFGIDRAMDIVDDYLVSYGQYNKESYPDGEWISETKDGNKYKLIFKNNEFIKSEPINLYVQKEDKPLPKKDSQSNVKIELELSEAADDFIPPSINCENNLKTSETFVNLKCIISDESELYAITVDSKKINNSKSLSHKLQVPIGNSQIIVKAYDVYGNDSEFIVDVTRTFNITQKQIELSKLNPGSLKVKKNKDRIAVVIGIQDYLSISDTKFADKDALAFIDFANLNLGIPSENIKYVINDSASYFDIIEINNWMASKINKNTEVFFFYAGHGGNNNGESLLLPFDFRSSLIAKTSIKKDLFIKDILSHNPNHVFAFFDACFSGLSREGDSLISGLRNISIAQEETFNNVTIFNSSSGAEFSSDLDEANHGLFSYFLMKGLEGEADSNDDNSISTNELYSYIKDNVSSKALNIGIAQNPSLLTNTDKVITQW